MPVQNYHPAKRVHIVNRILSDFHAGRRDAAEFWIDMPGKFVHIRCFAVRHTRGEYLGTMEVVQDIAPLPRLTTERRMLDDARAIADPGASPRSAP